MKEIKKTILIDKKYTSKLIIAIELARQAVSELQVLNNKSKRKKDNNIIYKVEDLYIRLEESDNSLHFWFYSDEITNWMDGKKGINFSIFFDENKNEGRIQYYRDSFIE